MTKFTRPTAIQTTLVDIGRSLRSACGSSPELDEALASMNRIYGQGLEGSTPVDDGEPSPHPDLVNDTTRAIEAGFYDEYEPEDE